MVLIGMHTNAELKEHTAIGNISVQVLDGEINFFTEQQKFTLTKGQMITLQANIPHSVTALKESFFLLTLVKNR
jgi:quercetin dioxygenase-like cupin family protein